MVHTPSRTTTDVADDGAGVMMAAGCEPIAVPLRLRARWEVPASQVCAGGVEPVAAHARLPGACAWMHPLLPARSVTRWSHCSRPLWSWSSLQLCPAPQADALAGQRAASQGARR